MTTLTVGAGMQYATIALAVAASHDGDVVLVEAGTYKNDFLQIDDSITLQAVGGMATIQATVPPTNEKGIITVGDGSHSPDVTINGFVLTGATISAAMGGNGAGIRYQSGNLVLNDDLIANNQNGLLATPEIANTGTIVVDHSDFAANGAGDGYTHNIYIGHVAQFTFEHSVSTDARVGHDIKSRALSTNILNSTISDGPSGTASYEIDLPNGGNAVIQGNTIEQGPHSGNPVIISYGEEGALQPGSLVVSGNTILNDMTSHPAVAVRNSGTSPAVVNGNSYWGLAPSQLSSGPATLGNNVSLAAEPKLSTALPWGNPGKPIAAQTITASDARLSTGTETADIVLAGSNDVLTLGVGGGTVVAVGQGNTIFAGAGALHLSGTPGSSTTVYGGSNTFLYDGEGGTLTFIAGSGTSTINGGSGTAAITFGAGATTVNTGTGHETLTFLHGQGGGNDIVNGFVAGRDVPQYKGFSGSALAAESAAGNSVHLTLTDGTHVTYVLPHPVPPA